MKKATFVVDFKAALDDLRPDPADDFYADFDEDTALYCVFGTESGFAYGTFASMEQAEEAASARRERKDNRE